jgi:hypothetical protein
MSEFNTFDLLLRGLPQVYNKTLGTQVTKVVDFLAFNYRDPGTASNNVNIMDAVSYGTDTLFQAISDGRQQSIIGVSPIELADISQINDAMDELALPGYLFNISPTVAANGVSLGYPTNLSKSFYITINNTAPESVEVPITLAYGNFNDSDTNTSYDYYAQCIETDGEYFYISDPSNSKIVKTNLLGRTVSSWKYFNGNDSYAAPIGMVIFNNYLYVADFGNCRIVKTDTYGNFIGSWGTWGTGNTNLKYPTDVKTDGTYLYVTDSSNHRILKLDLDLTPGPFIAEWGTLGSGNTNLNGPQALTILGTDIYISDTNNSRIVQIPTSLAAAPYTAAWGTFGTSGQQLKYVDGITTDGTYLYLSDRGNYRIGKLALASFPGGAAYSTTYATGATSTISGAIYDGTTLYVCATPTVTNLNHVLMFNTVTDTQITTPNIYFKHVTPQSVIIPSGGSATFQYTPDPTNPYSVVGSYSLVTCSFLPVENNYNITTDFGADETSVVFPPNCIEQVGKSFGVPRMSDEPENEYKKRIKLQAFGDKLSPVAILSFLKKVRPEDSTIKVYEWFTQPGVNTGFADLTKNTSNTDLYNFILAYPGGIAAYELDSNNLTLSNVASFSTFVQTSDPYPNNAGGHPYYMFVTFTSSLIENRGVYTGGASGYVGYSGYSGFSGTYGSMNSLYSGVSGYSVSDAESLTTTFHSSLEQGVIGAGYASYGGFLDTSQYAPTEPAKRMAFLVNAMKSAGITLILVQLF